MPLLLISAAAASPARSCFSPSPPRRHPQRHPREQNAKRRTPRGQVRNRFRAGPYISFQMLSLLGK